MSYPEKVDKTRTSIFGIQSSSFDIQNIGISKQNKSPLTLAVWGLST